MNRARFWTATSLLALGSACADLDALVHNPVHCSWVGESTCQGPAEVWDQICVPCDEEYDWEKEYDWQEGTIDGGQTVRPIPNDSVTRDTIETEDGAGSLDLYFLPAHGDDPALAEITVVYNHGNYAGVEHYQPRMRFLHEAGYSVLAWDYRGYGKSEPPAAPTAAEFLADARQIRALVGDYVPDPERVVVYANSLGGIPAIEMALSEEPCALFLEAPFVSLNRAGIANTGVSMPEGLLSMGEFENIEKIKGYDGPLLTMVGTADQVIPHDDVADLHDNAPGPKEIWSRPGVKHGIGQGGGVPEGGLTDYYETMESFLYDTAPGCLGG